RLVPGGPIDQMMDRIRSGASEAGAHAIHGSGSMQIPPAVLAALNAHYHLDQPAPVAYVLWLRDVLALDLGTSYKFALPVWGLLKARFPVTLYFSLIGFLLAYLVCVPLGIWKALKHGSPFDFASSAVVFIGYSIPGWALGAVLLVLFGGGSFWNVFPLGGFRSDT